MTNALKYIYISLILSVCSISYAQKKEIVQFSGITVATGTDIVVPYVSVKNVSYRDQIFIANHEGYFSFVAHKGDVIEFTSIGYKSTTITIPEDIIGDKYTIQVDMESMVEELPMITIGPPLPWASIEEFNAAFLGMNPGGDATLHARRNLSNEALASLSLILPRSAEEIQNFNSTQRHIQMSNRAINQNFANPLTNPFAWGQLINQIKRGDFSRQKLKY